MTTITLEEARAKLPEVIESLAAGEEVVITRNARPVAKLVAPPCDSPRPVFGRGKGKHVVLADDDEYLKAFEEYMP
jgi:prevent-host-death family protein